MVSEQITMTSDMQVGGLFSTEDADYSTIRYDIHVSEGGNAFSAIATYSFEEVVLSLGLIDKKTGNLV